MQEVVYEGDKLTLFGTLTYDTNTDQASFDDTVSMMATQAKDSIIQKLNWDYAKDFARVIWWGFLGIGLGIATYGCVKAISNRLREKRLASDKDELAQLDA